MRKPTLMLISALIVILLALGMTACAQAEDAANAAQGAPDWLKTLTAGKSEAEAQGLPAHAEAVLGDPGSDAVSTLGSPAVAHEWHPQAAAPARPRASISYLVSRYSELVELFLQANGFDPSGAFRLNEYVAYDNFDHFLRQFPGDVPKLAEEMGKTDREMLQDGIDLIRLSMP